MYNLNIITLNSSTGTSRAVFAKKMHLNQVQTSLSVVLNNLVLSLYLLVLSLPAVVWHLLVSTSSESTVWQTPLRKALLQTIHTESIDFFPLSHQVTLARTWTQRCPSYNNSVHNNSKCVLLHQCCNFSHISANQKVPLFLDREPFLRCVPW